MKRDVLKKCVVSDQFGSLLRDGFRMSDWKGPKGHGIGTECEGSRSLARVNWEGVKLRVNAYGKGNRQEILGQIEVNGPGQGSESKKVRERDRTENVITGQGKENVRMLDLVSMQPQEKLGFDWLAPIENMVLDNPAAEKGRNADEGKSGSVADRHPILTEYAIRSLLQDCTNDGIQQGGIERPKVSMGGKGQWK